MNGRTRKQAIKVENVARFSFNDEKKKNHLFVNETFSNSAGYF